jgi:ribonuclease P protein component
MIPYKNRFHGHGSIRYLYQKGKAIKSHLMIIKVIRNPHRKESRFAVVISKKVVKSAVGRNLIRRRVYEYLRTKMPHFNEVYDIVVIISSGEMLAISHQEMVSHMNQIFSQFDIK